jgi:tetratricopeptide (TPR) repeat protein
MKFPKVLSWVLLIAPVVLFASVRATESVYKKAVRDFAAGKFSVSRQGFEKVLESDTGAGYRHVRSKCFFYLGDIGFFSGDNASALQFYKRALDDKKINPAVRYRIGRTMVFDGKYGEGMTELREFLVRKKANDALEDHALFWIARAYQGLGQKENAIRTLDILTNLQPGTDLKDAVIRYRAALKKWDQKKEYQEDLKNIFSKEEDTAGSGPEDLTGPGEPAPATNLNGESVSSLPVEEVTNGSSAPFDVKSSASVSSSSSISSVPDTSKTNLVNP